MYKQIKFLGRINAMLFIGVLLCYVPTRSTAQILVNSVDVEDFTTAGEGDLYEDENDVVYIGMQDGSLRRIWPERVTILASDGNDLVYTNEADSTVRIDLGIAKGFEKIVIWAEESQNLGSNSLEWSFGNGDEGFIGIPLPEEWEAYAVSFHADNTSNGSNEVEIDVVDINANSSFNVLFSFTASGADDNLSYTEILGTPVFVPAGTTLGFRTNSEVGAVSSARVAVWLRR